MSDNIRRIIEEKEKRRRAKADSYIAYKTTFEAPEYLIWSNDLTKQVNAIARHRMADITHFFNEGDNIQQIEMDCGEYNLIITGYNLQPLFHDLLLKNVSHLYSITDFDLEYDLEKQILITGISKELYKKDSKDITEKSTEKQ
jgi:hypothetical protein